MIGKTKLGLFIIAAVIIVLIILFTQSRKQQFYNGTFVTVGGSVGNIYQADEEVFGNETRDTIIRYR